MVAHSFQKMCLSPIDVSANYDGSSNAS